MQNILLGPTKDLISKFWGVLSNLLMGVIFFIIGWIIAKVLKILIAKLLRMIKIDFLVEESGLKEVLVRGHVTKEPSELLANIIYWLLILVSLSLALTLMGVSIPTEVVDNLFAFIPRIVLGLIIFIVSLFIGNIVEGAINTTAANAGVEKPYVFGRIASIAVVVFGFVLALQVIGIGGDFVTTAFNIILASVAFGFALAFGLGAKDLVKEWLEGTFKKKQ